MGEREGQRGREKERERGRGREGEGKRDIGGEAQRAVLRFQPFFHAAIVCSCLQYATSPGLLYQCRRVVVVSSSCRPTICVLIFCK